MNTGMTKPIAALAFAGILAAGCGKETPEKKPGAAPAATAIAQKTCPVMEGQKINPKLYVDHGGRRIYVCCRSCIEMFKKDPEKYIKKVDAELAGLKAGSEVAKPEVPAEKGHEGHGH